jgi:hypothetical protein
MTETRATTGDSTDTDETTPTGGPAAAEEERVSDHSAENGDRNTGATIGTSDQPPTTPNPVAHDPSLNGEATDQLDGWQADQPRYTRAPGMPPPPDQPDSTDTVVIPSVATPATASVTGSGAEATATFQADSSGEQLSSPAAAAMRAVRVGEVRPRVSTPRGPRRARLVIRRVDPWSVMKFSFAVSLVLFIVIVVAASVLYLALDTMGVFASINETVADLIQSSGGDGSGPFRITAQGVIGTAAVLGGLNVLLFTSLATLGAFIYNVCADLVGGVEVTLAERD